LSAKGKSPSNQALRVDLPRIHAYVASIMQHLLQEKPEAAQKRKNRIGSS
jgi:hypothetical protein